MKPTVFIHTNDRQIVGALVAEHALKRNSAHAGAFDVRILRREDHPWFEAHEGRPYLRDGAWRAWRNDDLQSFTPLRFLPPEAMGFAGRALVIDPDIFAVADVFELLARDMQGKAILCRRRSGWKKKSCFASSAMLLDCARLRHWRCREGFEELFTGQRDYADWICLRLEDEATIGAFEDEWNDFDRLTPATRLLHNTRRWTQPWKTGLPVDFVPGEKFTGLPGVSWLMRKRREWFGDHAFLGRYLRHPDARQERFFFGLLRECLERGVVSEELLRREMKCNHVRHDALEVLERTPPLVA
ncbi:MAG: hypothetical protein OZ948_05340 [Deltaproteobacteria bacterium]|nr:hypothetical protein [Deltaproteobacteria bacterium]